eukprot:Em0024g116a
MAEERATRVEQQLLEAKQQNETLQQQIRIEVQQADERTRRAEEKAARQLIETKQENDALQQQIRIVVQSADERARRAEEGMSIAASVRHPNLLLFIGATLGGSKSVIITELMLVNLRSIISVLVRDNVISIGTDVACGLNYLHLDGWSPIYAASSNGHLEVLIEARAIVNHRNKKGQNSFYTASARGHLEVLKALVKAKANVNQCDKNGWSPMYVASERGYLEVVKTLIDSGANVNECNKDGESPLFTASSEGHLEVVKALIEAGANVKLNMKVYGFGVSQSHSKAYGQFEKYPKHHTSQKPQGHRPIPDVRTRRAEERATRTEQQLLEAKQQKEALQQQIRIEVQQADERTRKAEEKAARQLIETKQENDALQQQIRIEVQKADERARRAEERMGVREAMFRGVKVAAMFLHEEIISPHNTDLFIREMNIAASVRHPNLLLFIGATLGGSKPVIITELMPVNLRSIISVLVRDHDISIGTDVACGLNYLHLVRPDPIIHQDVSSANVLVERTELGGYRAKVSDYGSANFLSKVTTMGPGNASYSAPESMNPRLQSPKMDVTAMTYSCLKWPLDSSQTKACEPYSLIPCCGKK